MSRTRVGDCRAWARSGSALCLEALLACCVSACIPDLGARITAAVSAPDADFVPSDDAGAKDGSVSVPDGSTMPDSGSRDAGDLLAEGEVIFLVRAGTVPGGCASCHGSEGRGDVGIGPNIRGRTRANIVWALANVDVMQPIHLSSHEVDAVAAYVASLVP